MGDVVFGQWVPKFLHFDVYFNVLQINDVHIFYELHLWRTFGSKCSYRKQ